MQHDTVVNLDPAELERRQQQESHLRLLSIFHYVLAAMAVAFSAFFVIYMVFGGVMLLNPDAFDGSEPPPPFVGCLVLGFGAVAILVAWAYAAFTAYAGRCLARRRRYVLCLVSAGASCMIQPLGTLLGIFTLLVLVQPGVRDMFAVPPVAAPDAAVEG